MKNYLRILFYNNTKMSISNTLFNIHSQINEFNIDIDELTEHDLKAQQPKNINITLKQHQLTLLQRCIEYETQMIKLKNYPSLANSVSIQDEFKTNIGIIADRAGSGKSYVILSLLMNDNLIEKDNRIIRSCGLNNIVFYLKEVRPVVKTNMLVIPHNLCSQWETYVKTFSENINYKMINKQKTLDTLFENKIELTSFDLFIVTATFYNKVCLILNKKNIKCQRIIFDEVDNLNIPGCYNLNIPGCYHLNAQFYWFITASYGNLLYPKGYTKYDPTQGRCTSNATGLKNSGLIKNVFIDLYDNLPQSLIKVLVIKNSKEYIESSISLPTIITNIIKSKTPNTINILQGIVDKNIIECLNAGDVERAISHINSNNKCSEDNIISIMIDKYKKQLVNMNIKLSMRNDYVYESESYKLTEIANLTAQIDQINTKMNLIISRIQNNDMCSICYDDVENKTVTKCCQNPFCFKCIHLWLSNKAVCPLCKTKMTNLDVFVVSKESEASTSTYVMEEILDENEFNEKFDKWKNFEILLKKKKNQSKILIFSNYENTFFNIIPLLKKHDIKFDYIKGNGSQINSTVKKYKSDQLDVLLVNGRHYATGMNLENTSDIVMFHKFETQMEHQVIGRAHRYGRTENLNVHYLLYDNEIQ